MSIKINEMNDFSGLIEIKPAWQQLRKAVGESNVYTHPDWIYAWRFLPKTGEPIILTAMDSKTLIGIATLQIKTFMAHGIPIRKIGFIGDSPLNDFLILDRHEEVVSEFMNHLCNKKRSWGAIELSRLNHKSSALHHLRTIIKDYEFKMYETNGDPNGICTLKDYDSYINRRSRHYRKWVRQTRNRVDRLGNISIERYCGLTDTFSDPQSLEKLNRMFRDAIACGENSWQAKVRAGTSISDTEAYTFFKELIYSFALMDKLFLHVMYAGRRPVAYQLSFFEEYSIMIYKQAFDMEFGYYRPGAYLFDITLRDAAEMGLYNVDLMSIERTGGYKYRHIDNMRKTKTITVFNKTFSAFLKRMIMKEVLPKVKHLMTGLRSYPKREKNII